MPKIGSVNVDANTLQQALKANADEINYTGAGDALVDFGDATSFYDEDNSAKTFKFTLKNTSASKKSVQFNKILSGTLASHSLLKEGTVDTGLTCETGEENTTDVLIAYLEKHPIRLRSIKFSVDDASQLDEPIVYKKVNPFSSPSEKRLIPSSYQSQDTNNPKMVEIESQEIEKWTLSDMATISYAIGAGRTVNITLKFGAAISEVRALEQKAADAKVAVARLYASAKAK